MEKIGIICEYNPLHNGHIYHIKKIKEMYPNSLLILALNGYFLERGEVSILTKEEKTNLALLYGVDIVLELPTLFGTQSADIFASTAVTILHHFRVDKLVFGSELHNIQVLNEIVDYILEDTYQEKVRALLDKGLNYPTALSKAIPHHVNFNHPNDLLAISYIKAIKQNRYSITPISIKRTSDYHDLTSNEQIISASNIRNKLFLHEDIKSFLPKESLDAIIPFDQTLFFKLLKTKILSTPHLENFLTVDEGIESRLVSGMIESEDFATFMQKVKTKRYTYNKINRMCIHILLGIQKSENIKELSYIRILGFTRRGKEYIHSIKKDFSISTQVDKTSIQYKTEIKAALIYDLLHNTHTYDFEIKNKPIFKV